MTHPAESIITDIIFSLSKNPYSPLNQRYYIFPTSVFAEKITTELRKREIPYNPDSFTTLHGFCTSFHADHSVKTRIISEGQALHILSRSLENIKQDIPFFFTQGYPSAGTVQDLLSLRNIVSQRRIELKTHTLILNSEKCTQISRAIDEYLRVLDKEGLLDSSGLIDWTIKKIFSSKQIIFDSVIIYGLYDIFNREQELICTIRDRSSQFQYAYLTGEDSRIYRHPDWIGSECCHPIPTSPGHAFLSSLFTDNPVIHSEHSFHSGIFLTQREEIEKIAEEIHTLIEQGISPEDITIASPEIASLLPLIDEVFRDFGISWHSHLGEPLIREPIIHFLLDILSVVSEPYPREKVVALISSPFFHINNTRIPHISLYTFDYLTREAGIEGGESWDRALSVLKEPKEDQKYRLSIPLKELAGSIDTILEIFSVIQSDFNQLRESLSIAGYSAVLQKICDEWLHPRYTKYAGIGQDPLTVREIRAFHYFIGCLNRLSSTSSDSEIVTLSSFRRHLAFLLDEPVNFSEYSGGVNVMGLRQTVLMHYPCLFLCGLIEGDIPHPSTRFPLLTSKESELLGSRDLDEVIRGEQYYFISALEAGKIVFLSVPKSRNERTLLSSSFLERITKNLQLPEWGRDFLHSKKHSATRAGKCIANQDIQSEPEQDEMLKWLSSQQMYGFVADRILMEDWFRSGISGSEYEGILSNDEEIVTWLKYPSRFGSDRIWSSTQLETYAGCPFRFFLERVVHVSPLPDVDLTLSPASKGTLVHNTLCRFYTEWCKDGPRQIKKSDLETASALLQEIGKQMSDTYSYQSPVWYATVVGLLGTDKIPGLLDRFVAHEANNEHSYVYPTAFELAIQVPHISESNSGPPFVTLDNDTGEPIRIQGTIDRVDVTRDGYFTIIDYKTGSSYPNSKKMTEGSALQLPLYLLAFEKMHESDETPLTGIGGSYYEISSKIKQTWPLLDPEKKHLVGLSEKRLKKIDFRPVTIGALDSARRYIGGIREGIFPLHEGKCPIERYCEYHSICRYDAFRLPESEEEGDDE